ncbi:MAG TPA: hypothetical protein VGZ48_02885 [Candidatus Acidoferrales bacterium]|nr:hypothetical protein [Candidatus Acidoferrales bacterium]
MRKRTLIVFAASLVAIGIFFFAGANPAARAGQAQAEKSPPKSGAQSQGTQEVIFGKLVPYNHQSGWFTVSLPENWTVKDNSTLKDNTLDEVILIVSDPTENGIFVVRASASKDLTPLELSTFLKTFVHDHMSTLDSFSMGEPLPLKGDTFHIIFRYTQTVQGNDFRMYGESFIQQHNGYLGTITILIPQEQYSSKSKAAYEVTDSFHVTAKK